MGKNARHPAPPGLKRAEKQRFKLEMFYCLLQRNRYFLVREAVTYAGPVPGAESSSKEAGSASSRNTASNSSPLMRCMAAQCSHFWLVRAVLQISPVAIPLPISAATGVAMKS